MVSVHGILMDDEIYIRTEEGLEALSKSLFASEDRLQRELADNPQLLAGDELTPEAPRRWALVARETDVPDKEGGSERWSADHLFVDQDAVPTIVEVKRSDDTRIRRRVVGQMLDYASHARKYWEGEGLRARFEETHSDTDAAYGELGVTLSDKGRGHDPGGTNLTVTEFWEAVESNLRSGHLRLLFVADKMPRELREIVEYLNEQMRDTEVFAIEVTRFQGESQDAFSPSVYGKTAGGSTATSGSSTKTPPSYEGDDFLGDVEAKEDAGEITTAEAEAMREIYRFIREEADDYEFGGSSNVTVKAQWDATAGTMFSLSSSGGMTVWMAEGGFDEAAEARQSAAEDWLERMGELDPGFDYFDDNNEVVSVKLIGENGRVDEFEQACRDFVSACEAAIGPDQ